MFSQLRTVSAIATSARVAHHAKVVRARAWVEKIIFRSDDDVSISTGLCQSFMVTYYISIFRLRTYNFYPSDELVNSVCAFEHL